MKSKMYKEVKTKNSRQVCATLLYISFRVCHHNGFDTFEYNDKSLYVKTILGGGGNVCIVYVFCFYDVLYNILKYPLKTVKVNKYVITFIITR